jgi:hypothetical protein
MTITPALLRDQALELISTSSTATNGVVRHLLTAANELERVGEHQRSAVGTYIQAPHHPELVQRELIFSDDQLVLTVTAATDPEPGVLIELGPRHANREGDASFLLTPTFWATTVQVMNRALGVSA